MGTEVTHEVEKGCEKVYTVRRDGDRPLRFHGMLLGEGEHGTGGTSGYKCDWNRGVRVRIYRRKAGGYVVTWAHWSQWQGERGQRRAEVCATPEGVLIALRDGEVTGGTGELRAAELEALEDAATRDDGLSAIAVEDLDAETKIA
jgi:hypothetical protein